MRPLPLSIFAAAVALLAAPAAHAHVVHTVAPGDTLWSISHSSNMTTRTVALYNGLTENSHVVIGTPIKIPSITQGRAALRAAGIVPAGSSTAAGAKAATATPSAGAPQPLGAYVVRRGDTLSALAAQTGVPTAQMAYVNGLPATAHLLTGTIIKLPTGAAAPAQAAAPAPATRVIPVASPTPTAGRLSAEQIKAVAAQHGAPASLAAAIAWQESGFNNAVVSSANARGIMQVMPGTWDWVNKNLASTPLNPQSATDNVRAGSLYLAQLLRQTGGDRRLAAAAYYQGLSSVRSRGMFDDTKQYVDNVIALSNRFGG